MSALVKSKNDYIYLMKGAPEVIKDLCAPDSIPQ